MYNITCVFYFSFVIETQLVKAKSAHLELDLEFLLVKGEFFFAAVTKCLLMGECWVSVK